MFQQLPALRVIVFAAAILTVGALGPSAWASLRISSAEVFAGSTVEGDKGDGTSQEAASSDHVPDQVLVNGTTVAKRAPPKAGDICRVCNRPIHDSDVVYLARGQRLPIHVSELDANVRGQLEQVLARLEPRGAFIGAWQDHPALSKAWFLAGLYILLGLVFAALCAHRALHVGHSPVVWFGVGLLLNAFGYLLLFTRPKREVLAPAGVPAGLRKISATPAPQPCPKCGTLNHPSAVACIGCGAALEPRMDSEVVRAGLRPR